MSSTMASIVGSKGLNPGRTGRSGGPAIFSERCGWIIVVEKHGMIEASAGP